MKSIQFNRREEATTPQAELNLKSTNNVNFKKQSLLKTENNHINSSFSPYDAQPLLKLALNQQESYEYDTHLENIRLNKKKKLDKLKIIGLYSTAIILNGIGDGLNNTHQKTMGHIFNAASIGVLLTTPFFIDYEKDKWYWYLLTYTSLRVTLFDATYNVTTKQPIDFVGTTAITDKIYRVVDLWGASKAMGLVVGLTIPLKLL